MKKLVVIIFLILPALSFASDYEGIPETFFEKLKEGDPEKAIEYLYDTNRWISQNSDQVVNLKSQLLSLDGLVGKYLFHELISETKAGTRYSHLIYLVGYERQPLRFQIKLYKAEDKWRFHGVSFDAELTDHIQELANMNLVK